MAKKTWVKKLANYLFFFLCAYGGLVTYLYTKQREILYYPFGEVAPPAGVSEVYGIDKSGRGFAPKGWYIEGKDPEKPVILHFHGNAGNVASRYIALQNFITKGYGVLFAEYSGYGGNSGAPSEESIYHDAESYYAYLKSLGLENERIIFYGESLGSGPATYLAEKYDAQALVLEVPYDSIYNVASDKYWFIFGLKYLLKDHFDNLSRIADINMPVLMMLAGRDELIPHKNGRALFDKAVDPKVLHIHEEANHNGLKRDDVLRNVEGFLESLHR